MSYIWMVTRKLKVSRTTKTTILASHDVETDPFALQKAYGSDKGYPNFSSCLVCLVIVTEKFHEVFLFA